MYLAKVHVLIMLVLVLLCFGVGSQASSEGLPGQPSSPRLTSSISSAIIIKWSAPVDIGDGITGYNVKWQEVNGTSVPMQKVVISATATLAALAPYTWYAIQVQAYNDRGNGPWSVPVKVRTGESVPSAASGNFKVGSSSPLSLDVSWDAIPEKEQRGKLLGYRVYYMMEGSANEQSVSVGPNQLRYTLKGLEFASYSVRVTGFTAVGVGKSTAILKKFPKEGASSPPRNLQLLVVSSKSIKVSWEKPLKINGHLKTYVVSFGQRSDNLDASRYTLSTEYDLTFLEEHTTYFVQVYAETTVSGDPTSIVQATTLEDAPRVAPVINQGETKAEDARTIRVTWQEIPPIDQNGVILGYTVVYNVKSQSAQFSQSTTSTSTMIRGLKPFTKYCIRVLGYTKIGSSPRSGCTDVTTLVSDGQKICSCYTFTNHTTGFKNWKEANSSCALNSKHLVVMETEREWEFIRNEIYKRRTGGHTDEWYIGLFRKTESSGNWTWINGKPLTINRWQSNEPGAVDIYALIHKEYPKGFYGSFGSNRGVGVRRAWICEEETDNCQGVCLRLSATTTPPISTTTATTQQTSSTTQKLTYLSVPSKPKDVKAKLHGDGNIGVSWHEPDDPNGILTEYRVYCEGRRQYNSSFHDKFYLVESKTSRYTSITKSKLKAGTEYTVYVTAFTVKGEGAQSDPAVVNTPSKAPPPPEKLTVNEADITPTTATVHLTTSSDENGKVIVHQVILEMLGKEWNGDKTTLPSEIHNYTIAQKQFYITAQFGRKMLHGTFVLGDEKIFHGYYNAALKPQITYRVYIRGVTEVDGKWLYGEAAILQLPRTGSLSSSSKPLQTSDNTSMVWMITALIEGAFIVILTAVIIIGYLRTRRAAQGSDENVVADHYDAVNPVGAAVHLGPVSEEDANPEGRRTRHVARMNDEYAMLERSTMQGPDQSTVYMALVKSRNANDQIQDFDARSEALLENNEQQSNQTAMVPSTYVNITGMSAVYANQ